MGIRPHEMESSRGRLDVPQLVECLVRAYRLELPRASLLGARGRLERLSRLLMVELEVLQVRLQVVIVHLAVDGLLLGRRRGRLGRLVARRRRLLPVAREGEALAQRYDAGSNMSSDGTRCDGL